MYYYIIYHMLCINNVYGWRSYSKTINSTYFLANYESSFGKAFNRANEEVKDY